MTNATRATRATIAAHTVQAPRKADSYIELHTASAFSFLRSACSPETLVARAAAQGMPALALTDHMSLAGVVRFQAACAHHGIQPIVGVEFDVAEPVFGAGARPAHLVLLAENATGYAHLCHLLTQANLTQPEAPVIPWKDIADQPGGLILLTGGRDGTLMRLLLAGKRQAALETVCMWSCSTTSCQTPPWCCASSPRWRRRPACVAWQRMASITPPARTMAS